MTLDQLWTFTWNEYMDYLCNNKRRPSKYREKDMRLVNWLKYNRKLLNRDKLSEDRKEKMLVLLKEIDKFRRVNQYSYYHKS